MAAEAPRKPSVKLVEHGRWNVCEGSFGVPDTGKSCLQVARAVELQRQTGAFVFAHTPGKPLPEKLYPSGLPVRVRKYRTIEACAAQLRTDAGGIHAITMVSCMPILELALRVSRAELKRNGGTRGVPVIVILDEGAATREASPSYLDPRLLDFIVLRRDYHIGLLFNAQSPRLINNQFLCQATRITCFKLKAPRDLPCLETNGFPSEKLGQIQHLTVEAHNFVSADLSN